MIGVTKYNHLTIFCVYCSQYLSNIILYYHDLKLMPFVLALLMILINYNDLIFTFKIKTGYYGERGITYGDPGRGTLQPQITPLLVSLIWSFYFHLTSLRQTWFGNLKIKIPRLRWGSNLFLRREGDSNPRYPFEVHTLSRRAN